jgi:zinc D-Ala-D-Ala carboxypeptidase
MGKLSDNFSLDELSMSQMALRLGIDNTPPLDAVMNLVQLCDILLEPIRTLLGVPLHIDSGYRTTAVNAAIGGAKDSAHLEGRAADFVPIGMPLKEAFDRIRMSDLPYDQVIIECGSWIHVAIARTGAEPRMEALTASGGPGHWTYDRVSIGVHNV